MLALSAPTPECELRSFHKFLERFPAVDFHKSVAAQFLTYPARLDEMLGRSLIQCGPFNTRDAFHDGREGQDGINDDMANSLTWANRLVVAIARNKVTWPGDGLAFDYVDYEIVPFRESGESGQMRHQLPQPVTGRFDVLLSDAKDRTPVVVEVKAASDSATTPRTLIQLLTYAVEMGTSNQRRRLNSIYPDAFASYDDQPRVDLCVMKEIPDDLSPEAMRNSDERHAQVEDLCRKLLAQPHTRALIRRIIWLHPRMASDGKFTFAKRFICTPT
jgi:hypothetical protein